MSDKIKSKDLSYDASLPPFLQRLHAQKAGRGDLDRHERQITRATKPKNPDDDDGPTVVDECGESVSKEEYDRLTKDPTGNSPDTAAVKGDLDPATKPKASGGLKTGDSYTESGFKPPDQNTTNGTVQQRKRKAVKVVGEGEDGDDELQSSSSKVIKKAKKKTKALKLAFDDDDGE